jgi:hypothetical protein
MSDSYFKLEVFVPKSHEKDVKDALASAGAGKLGNYDSCIWSTDGVGQFRPLAGSNPHLGQCDELEVVPEAKLECIVECSLIKPVIAALRQAHPYETPAFSYSPVFLQ